MVNSVLQVSVHRLVDCGAVTGAATGTETGAGDTGACGAAGGGMTGSDTGAFPEHGCIWLTSGGLHPPGALHEWLIVLSQKGPKSD